MPSAGLEILGVTLAILGWISAIVSCALPMWRVSAFIGVNIVTAQITWEGIWMNCVVQSTGQMQCKVHDSMLALSGDLQAARALTIISVVLGIVGVMVSTMGAKCTNSLNNGPVSWSRETGEGDWVISFRSLSAEGEVSREMASSLQNSRAF
uniref:Claudin n=1 Tax=Neogobius melanostomus TaxID=47308 RepID=A0A8C6TED8_9GOBI